MSKININGTTVNPSGPVQQIENGFLETTAAPSISTAVVGPQGPTGPKGDTGASGGGGNLFTQSSPAATWIIVHNLGRPVLAQVYVAGEGVITDLIDSDANTLTVVFSSPQSGQVVYS